MDALRRQLSGDLVRPGDDGWDRARQAWNLAVDQRPAAVVVAAGTGDVAATLAFASDRGLRVAPQCTGHGGSTLGPLDDTLLLRTTRLDGIEVDTAGRRVRVGAGLRFDDVVGPATDDGLAALHGLSGGVGVAGYTLGGGLGWLGRSHGLACNAVAALEVVLADGRTLKVDADTEPDLFWALRGGGGLGAIVTTLVLQLFPLKRAFAGQLAWPLDRAAEVAEAYRSWTTGLPYELTSVIRLMRFPPDPGLPPELRGQSLVLVLLVFAGDPAAGEELVAPLRGLGPASDTLATVPVRELPQIAGDPPGPLPGIGDSALLADLDVDAYLAVGGPQAETQLANVEVRHLGGALAHPAPGHGATGCIDEPFAFYAVGSPTDPVSATALRGELDRARERLAPSASGRTLLGFAERQPGLAGSFAPETVARLREIAPRFDPSGVIQANHALGS